VGISVFVMPLHTWLAGDFRTTWGPGLGTVSTPRPRRSAEEAGGLRDEFLSRLESLIGNRPDWDESGPPRRATAFSAHAFSLPFLQARRWSYRMKLPQLGVLESPQIWIPSAFDPVFHLPSPWSEEGELMVGSLPRLKSELDRLLEALGESESEAWAELREVAAVGKALGELVTAGIQFDAPVIVEG